MKTCSTCKHWEKENNVVGFYRDCSAVQTDNTERSWGAVIVQDIGYASLQTGPDFGCTLHEEKK